MSKILANIFSIKNEGIYRIIRILGFKLKIKDKHLELKNKLELLNNKMLFIWKLEQIYASGINKEKVNYEIENFETLGVTEEKREKKLIVSLTSYPDRMYDLHYTIYSLLNQSLKPDEVVLWLAREQFENAKISKKVLELQKNGLTIKWCEDLKSYKKLIPSLREFPNDIIVTADDDIYYDKNWLKDLYEEYLKQPTLIHAKRCHKFKANTPYNKWEHNISDNSASFSNFCTTGGGVLYPPNSLHKDVLNGELFKELAPNADDVWFWAMAVLAKVKIKVSENSIQNLIYVTPERDYRLYNEATLYSQNCGQNQNDIQIKNILDRYPQINEVLKNG